MKKRSLVVAFDRRHVGCLSPVLASAIAGAEEVGKTAPDPAAIARFVASLKSCMASVDGAIAADERQRVQAQTKAKRA